MERLKKYSLDIEEKNNLEPWLISEEIMRAEGVGSVDAKTDVDVDVDVVDDVNEDEDSNAD